MKYGLTLLVIGIFASLVRAEINLTDEQKQKLVGHHKVCTVPSRDEEYAKRLIDGDLLDDDQFKEYLFCISKRIGFQNEAGEVSQALLIEKLKKSIEDPSRAKAYSDTCLANKSNSPTDSAYKVITCILNINPKSSILGA